MKSSACRALDMRAEAFQSIERTLSPRRYVLELTISKPPPRWTLRLVPPIRPVPRLRLISGKLGSAAKSSAGEGDPRTRRELEAAARQVEPRRRVAVPRLQPVQVHEDAVLEHGLEQRLDVLWLDERPPLQERPRPSRALEGERAAHGGADGDEIEPARGTDELDQPALDDRVDVDALDSRLDPAQVGDVDHR